MRASRFRCWLGGRHARSLALSMSLRPLPTNAGAESYSATSYKRLPITAFGFSGADWCITLTRSVGGHRPQTVLGAYLDGSPGIGLNVGCWRELIGVDEGVQQVRDRDPRTSNKPVVSRKSLNVGLIYSCLYFQISVRSTTCSS